MSIRRKPLTEQQEQVVRLHEVDKLSFSEIGKKLGLSRSRVSLMWQEAQARLRDYEANGSRALSLLPAQVREFLTVQGWTDPAVLREAIESGRVFYDEHRKPASDWHEDDWDEREGEKHNWMNPGVRRRFNLRWCRKMGWKSWLVMVEWAGLPLPPPKKLLTCPHCGGTFPE